MNIFYVPEIASEPYLSVEESHHCVGVLRQQKGDRISVTDGKGGLYTAVLEDTNPKHCRLQIIERTVRKPDWNYEIEIAVAPTKSIDRMEWFVEKATEAGVNRIRFMRCKQSERREIKLERLVKVAVSAMKQSQKTILPQIIEITDFKDVINIPAACRMIAHCASDDRRLISDVYKAGTNTLILIGPEGDFSSNEIDSAIAKGFRPVSLGSSRLRTETAAFVACHTIHVLNQLSPQL